MPSFHVDKCLVSHDPPQISELNDPFLEDLERDVFEDEPLKHDRLSNICISSCNEKEGSQRDKDEDINFQVGSHSLDVNCWKFYGDPIYDTDLDDSREESVEFLPLK